MPTKSGSLAHKQKRERYNQLRRTKTLEKARKRVVPKLVKEAASHKRSAEYYRKECVILRHIGIATQKVHTQRTARFLQIIDKAKKQEAAKEAAQYETLRKKDLAIQKLQRDLKTEKAEHTKVHKQFADYRKRISANDRREGYGAHGSW